MVRKLLTTTALVCFAGSAALAADLPYRKEAPVYTPPPPPAFTWSGVYVGGQVGYGWGTSNLYDETTGFTPSNLTQSGIVGGVHVGYNYQVSQFVFGLEGDVNGSSESNNEYDSGVYYGIRKNVDASIRGRIGYAFDRVLIYATGGGAYGNFHTTYSDNFGDHDSFNNGRLGWTAGGGIEYAIDNNWSVRAEYRYTDYGHITNYEPYVTGDVISQHVRDNRIQAGFSYKFDLFPAPAPIVSKY